MPVRDAWSRRGRSWAWAVALSLAGACSPDVAVDKLIKQTAVDGDADGVADRIETYHYDVENRLVEVDHARDGRHLFTGRETHTWSEDGRTETVEGDQGVDGTVEAHSVRVYDEDGNLIQVDSNAGTLGAVDVHETFTWDDDGHLLTDTMDLGADGTVDNTQVQTWDDHGNMLTYELDYRDPEAPDVRKAWSYTYDSAGHVLTFTFDYGHDGHADQRDTSTYDRHGRLVSVEGDLSADGSPESVETWTYEVRLGGVVRASDRSRIQTDDDALVTRSVMTYDRDGRVLTDEETERSTDENGDPIYDVTGTTYGYDEDGYEVSEDRDDDQDGVADFRLQRSWVLAVP